MGTVDHRTYLVVTQASGLQASCTCGMYHALGFAGDGTEAATSARVLKRVKRSLLVLLDMAASLIQRSGTRTVFAGNTYSTRRSRHHHAIICSIYTYFIYSYASLMCLSRQIMSPQASSRSRANFFDSAVAWVVEGTGGGAEVGQQSTQPPDRESSG